MVLDSRRLELKADKVRQALEDLRFYIVDEVSQVLAQSARDLAPDAVTFEEAAQQEGPTGYHTLAAVEAVLVTRFEEDPIAIEAFRSSPNWSELAREGDAARAARAVVSDCLEAAGRHWSLQQPYAPSP